MYRWFALCLAACAVDPELSTSASELDQLSGEIEDGSVVGAVRVNDHVTASGGVYLSFSEGGYARRFVHLGADANVRTWVRIRAASASSASLTIQVDGGTPIACTLPVTASWAWRSCETTIWLEAGDHEIKLGANAGVQIDQIKHSTNGFAPFTEVYEVEAGSLVYPMILGGYRLSPTYAYVPNGSVGGRLDLDVAVPCADSFRIWARTNATTTADDEVHFGRNGTIWVPLRAPLTSTTGWAWSQADWQMWIDPSDTLTVTRDDDGLKLDKIVITNDDTFRLVEASPPPVLTKN